MVQLNKMVGNQQELRHNLKPNFKDSNFPEDGMWCYIQKMTSGKYSVMNYHNKKDGNFYKVFETKEQLDEAFEEIPLA